MRPGYIYSEGEYENGPSYCEHEVNLDTHICETCEPEEVEMTGHEMIDVIREAYPLTIDLLAEKVKRMREDGESTVLMEAALTRRRATLSLVEMLIEFLKQEKDPRIADKWLGMADDLLAKGTITATDVYAIGEVGVGDDGLYYEAIDDNASVSATEIPISGATWENFFAQVWTVNNYTTLTASADLFTSGMVGGYFGIVYRRSGRVAVLNVAGASPGVPTASNAISVNGSYSLQTTTGTYMGKTELQVYDKDQEKWVSIKVWNFIGNPSSVSATGETDSDTEMRVLLTRQTGGTGAGSINLRSDDSSETGIFEIIKYKSATSVLARVVKAPEKTGSAEATTRWKQGAFSDDQGFPVACAFHQERLILAGTSSQPQRWWGSQRDKFKHFETGDEDSEGLDFTISSAKGAIQWVASQQGLMFGTSSGEFTANATSSTAAITPTNIRIQRSGNYGSKRIAPVSTNNIVLFVDRIGRHIRELVYNFGEDNFLAVDLTVFSDHFTESGIVQLAYQQSGPILWAITADGKCIGMTYERDQNVAGWFELKTSGTFESVATIYGTTEDEVWFLCKRTVNSATVRYIERFKTGYGAMSAPGWETADEGFYVDSGVTASGSSTTLSGLDHLETETVQVWGDGVYLGTAVVASGAITLPGGVTATTRTAGLQYTSLIEPMVIEEPTQEGTSQGRLKRVDGVDVYVYASGDFEYADASDGTFYTKTIQPADGELYTGWVTLKGIGRFSRDSTFVLRQQMPGPLTVFAMVPHFQVTEETT